jgi:hypothetical protein
MKIAVPEALRAEIARLIDAVIADVEEVVWVRQIAERTRALPLYRGWTSMILIDADGQLIRYDHDDRDAVIDEPIDHTGMMTALVSGSRRYLALAPLIPPRPADARDCDQCGGTGELPFEATCKCGGCGWLPG